jgi:hypothetical protein
VVTPGINTPEGLKEKYSRKNRRFWLRSLHKTDAFLCIPITKDAKKYVLEDCLGDFVPFLRNFCGFGLLVPYNSFYMCSFKSCRVHIKAPHWVRTLLTSVLSNI